MRVASLATFWTFGKNLLDFFFPIECLGCGSEGAWLCDACLRKIPLRTDQSCPICRKRVTPYGQNCFACQGGASLDGIFVASYYRNPLLKAAIHTYKYRFTKALSLPLGTLLTDAVKRSDLPLPDIILPVPLHPRRLRYRGFNQSELLARELSSRLLPGDTLPMDAHILLRTRNTAPQMKTESKQERLKNLKNAFALSKDDTRDIRGRSFWLVDDVVTTGTTLEECATVLKSAGAKSVFGVVLAR